MTRVCLASGAFSTHRYRTYMYFPLRHMCRDTGFQTEVQPLDPNDVEGTALDAQFPGECSITKAGTCSQTNNQPTKRSAHAASAMAMNALIGNPLTPAHLKFTDAGRGISEHCPGHPPWQHSASLRRFAYDGMVANRGEDQIHIHNLTVNVGRRPACNATLPSSRSSPTTIMKPWSWHRRIPFRAPSLPRPIGSRSSPG